MSLLLDSSASMGQHRHAADSRDEFHQAGQRPRAGDRFRRSASRFGRGASRAIRVSSRPLSSRPTPADRHRCTTRSTSRSRNFEGQGRQRGRCAAAGAPVVFSDSEDTSSLVSFEEVLDLAKRSKQRSMPSRCAATATSRPEIPRGGVRHADAGPGDRRPSLLLPPSRI